MFSIFHWIIAYIYYECASINPFVRHDPREIERQIKRKRKYFYTLIAIDIASSFYDFFPNNAILRTVLWLIWVVILVLASVVMCIALWKMKNTIAQSQSGKVNWKLMVNHASAFLLFLVGYIVTEAIDHFTGGASSSPFYLTDWIVIALFGTISML
jgi:hypothetical protein